MLFDSDKYIDALESLRQVPPLVAPNNKVPPVNLAKLAFDKKIAPITVSYMTANECHSLI